jgi:DNA-binding winged helix-turn-helix (wHTH) protein
MKFIINFVLYFDSDTRVLALKNDENLSIELSKPANRLLCELIINNKITLEREDIIKSVWADYGFSTSTATLSNHISELRKAFANLGLNKEMIVTVPKIGFRLEAEIHPIEQKDDVIKGVATSVKDVALMDEPFLQINERVLSPSENRAGRIIKRIGLKMSILVAGILLAVIIAGVTFLILPQSEIIRPVTAMGKCSIHSLNNIKPSSDFIANVQGMIKKEKIDCTREPVEVYYTDTRQDNKLLKISFMAVCYPIDDGHYQNCKNYKFVR